jgi:hypothetical protein
MCCVPDGKRIPFEDADDDEAIHNKSGSARRRSKD